MSLLRHRDFRLLWAGETVSQVGTEVSFLALPLVAVSTIHASTFEVGLLTASATLAFLVVGLPAGVWIDRLRRRPVLIVADVGRFLALGSIPVAAALDVLGIVQLYAVALLTGVLTVFFDVAYQSYLPGLVGREQLVEGNAKLQASESLAQVAGPSVAGWLVQLLGAPAAVAAVAVQIVFLVRVVHLHAGVIGLLFSAGSLGGLVGALSASPWARRFGSARATLGGAVLSGAGTFLIPLVRPGPAILLFSAGLFLTSAGAVVYNVNQVSFRQVLCPDRLLGRMNATMRFIVWGTMPIGGVMGGILGSTLGLRNTLWVAAAGSMGAVGCLLASPLRGMRDLPAGPDPG